MDFIKYTKVNFILFLIVIFYVWLTPFSYAETMGTLTIENSDDSLYRLVRTHQYKDDSFIPLSKPEILKDQTSDTTYSLEKGTYRLYVDQDVDYYQLSIPDLRLEDPYHQRIVIKPQAVSILMLIGDRADKLHHHHLENPLLIDPEKPFFYGVEITLPSDYDGSSFLRATLTDHFPESVDHVRGKQKIVTSDGTELIENEDYRVHYASLHVVFTEQGLQKLRPNMKLTTIYEMAVKEEYRDQHLQLVGNHAKLTLEGMEGEQTLHTEDDYFSFKTKAIQLIKQDQTTKKKLQGALFSLYRGGELIGEVRTDRDGIAWFDGLTSGFYRLVEKEPPTNYYPLKGPVDVQIRDHESLITVYVDNERLPQLPKTGVSGSISLLVSSNLVLMVGLKLVRRNHENMH